MTDTPGPVKVRIVRQGAVHVTHSSIDAHAGARGVVCIGLTLQEQGAEVGHAADDRPELYLSIPWHPAEETIIDLPEYRGWRIYATEVAKYTLRIALVR